MSSVFFFSYPEILRAILISLLPVGRISSVEACKAELILGRPMDLIRPEILW